LKIKHVLIENPIRYFKGLIYSLVYLNALTEMVRLLRYVKIMRGFLMKARVVLDLEVRSKSINSSFLSARREIKKCLRGKAIRSVARCVRRTPRDAPEDFGEKPMSRDDRRSHAGRAEAV